MPALPSPLLSLLLALTPLSSSCQTVKSPGVERPASTGTDATAEAPAVSSPEASLEPVPELIVAPEPLDPEVEAYLANLASHETMVYDPVLGEESILIRPDAPPPGPWIEREETYARHIRARWLAQQGRHAEAEAIIREALAADPESITLNLSLAETLYAQGS
ncbi:MAG: tetratricopeptide repeat protein, partial [Candidatus Sumerlaeia bacterium]|nr:tetratricopeptide repeat protein [Candidatus Sumerlaeia bacterium]